MTRRELIELIRPERKRVLASLFVAVVQGAMLYPTLWLVRDLFDSAIPAGEVGTALLLCLWILVVRLLAAEASLLQRTLAMRAAKGASAYRRRQLMRWLLGSEVGSLEAQDPGVLQSRLVHETGRVDEMLNRALSAAVPAVVAALIALGAMSVLEWRLTLLTVAASVPVVWIVARGGTRTTVATRVFQAGYERYSTAVRFVVRHMVLVRSRGHVADEQAIQDAAVDNLRETGVAMALSFARQGRRQTISVTSIAVAVLALGSLLVIDGNLTVGELAAFYVSALVCGNAVGQVGSAIPELKGGLVAGERLAELTELTGHAAPVPARGTTNPPSVLPVKFHEVDFAYGGRPVLSHVDLMLSAGSHVDLRGPNGSGKSTVIRLALALVRPDAGTITVGGVPLDDLDGEQFRRRIGYAPQKPTFFNGSVLDNLLYGRPEATKADAERAAELAGVLDVIARLDGGFDAALGEDGSRLSGGEGQRLAIARALIGDPELVVLDEPGNHLPQDAVADIIERVRRARPGIALLTAGHGHLADGVADTSLRLTSSRLTVVTSDA